MIRLQNLKYNLIVLIFMTVEQRINNVIKQIDANPLIYHREADIRAMLYNELCKEYSELINTKLGYRTGLVHCEYFGGDGTRIDVVVLNKEDAEKIERHTLEKTKINGVGHIKLDDAIEIKTNLGRLGDKKKGVIGDKKKGEEGVIYKDIDKLVKQGKKNPKINLYLLYFVRYHTKKNKERTVEKRKKILKLVEKVRKDCKKKDIIFKTNNEKNYFLQKSLVP